MIPLSKPYFTKRENQLFKEVIDSGWVTMGPKVEEFEDSFKDYVGSKYAAAVSNCTTGMHLSLIALGVKPGDFVITVSHSYIATANSIRHAGAEPLFIDINNSNFNIDINCLDKFINDECFIKNGELYYRNYKKLIKNSPVLDNQKNVSGRVTCIIVPHQIGIPSNIYEIKKRVSKFNIRIIEDAACAIGSSISTNNKIQKIGNPVGDFVCFSFHPRKIITTGDGGMVTSNSKKLINKIKLLRNHGMSTEPAARAKQLKNVSSLHTVNGYNFRLTDIQAAVGIAQLEKLEMIINQRNYLANIYTDYLSKVNDIELYNNPKNSTTNWQSYPITITSEVRAVNLVNFLFKNGIFTKTGVMNSHSEPPYLKQDWKLPASELALEKTVHLPLFHTLKRKEIKFICNKIEEFFSNQC
jgi:perosamine synthetase